MRRVASAVPHETSITLPPCMSWHRFDDLADVCEKAAGTYCRPIAKDFAAVDLLQQPSDLYQVMRFTAWHLTQRTEPRCMQYMALDCCCVAWNAFSHLVTSIA